MKKVRTARRWGNGYVIAIMRASLEAFRAVFGARCRYGINALSDEPRRAVYVTALWECGCLGSGADYEMLTLLPCATHTADVAEDIRTV